MNLYWAAGTVEQTTSTTERDNIKYNMVILCQRSAVIREQVNPRMSSIAKLVGQFRLQPYTPYSCLGPDMVCYNTLNPQKATLDIRT
jgi:hypothetical protein